MVRKYTLSDRQAQTIIDCLNEEFIAVLDSLMAEEQALKELRGIASAFKAMHGDEHTLNSMKENTADIAHNVRKRKKSKAE